MQILLKPVSLITGLLSVIIKNRRVRDPKISLVISIFYYNRSRYKQYILYLYIYIYIYIYIYTHIHTYFFSSSFFYVCVHISLSLFPSIRTLVFKCICIQRCEGTAGAKLLYVI